MRLPLGVRSAWRLVRRDPGVHVAIVVLLALGLGVSGIGYAILDHALAPLGVDPTQVARLGPSFIRRDGGPGIGGMRPAVRRELRRQTTSFSVVVGVGDRLLSLGGGGPAGELRVAEVTEGFFDLVDIRPRLGRSLLPGDAAPGAPRVCVLGWATWQRAFGGDAGVLGATVPLGDEPCVIIGVMARGFTFPGAEAWTPLRDPAPDVPLPTYVRLRRSATWAAARAETATIGSRVAREYPEDFEGSVLTVRTLEEESRERLGIGLLGLLGPPAVLLLVACLNAAVLLVAQAVRREREMGIRLALGAGRAALLRQLLFESALLAVPAGILGLLLARAGLVVLRVAAPPSLDVLLSGTSLRPGTVAFVGLATLLTPLFFGLVPILHSLRVDVVSALHLGSRRLAGALGGYRFSDLAVVLQVAGALALVVWFANVERFFGVLAAPRWGFDPRTLTATAVSLAEPSAERSLVSWRTVLEAARGVPGVTSATLVDHLPSPFGGHERVRPAGESSVGVSTDVLSATDGLFDTLGVSLLEGRAVGVESVERNAHVAVVSESLARALWPGRDALGRVFRLGKPTAGRELTVIGVAPTLASLPSLPWAPHRVYMPLSTAGRDDRRVLIVRSTFEDPTLPRRLQAALAASLLARLPEAPAPLAEFFAGDRNLAGGFFLVRLVGAIGLVTLILAAVGLFAVTRQAVHAGTRELGIRAALGATPQDLLRKVYGRSLVQTGLGATLALGGTLWGLSVGFRDALHVGARDPRVWCGVAIALLAPLLGGYLPALRASRIDPARVMREE